MREPLEPFTIPEARTVVQSAQPLMLTRRRPASPIMKVVSVIGELALFVVLYVFLADAFTELGVGDSIVIADDAVLGNIFTTIPDLTGAHLYALVTAAAFLAIPVATWHQVLRPGGLFAGDQGERIVSIFLLLCLTVVFIGDILLVWYRVEGQIFNPLNPQQLQHPFLAIFFGCFFLLINLSVSLLAAKCFCHKSPE